MLNDYKYKMISPEKVFKDLAAQRIVFWADSDHQNINSRLGLVRAVGQFMANSDGRDVCLELSPQEFIRCEANRSAIFGYSTTPSEALAKLGQRMEYLCASFDNRLKSSQASGLSALAMLELGRYFGAKIHAVDVNLEAKDRLVYRHERSVGRGGIFSGMTQWSILRQRLDMDPEIAANIWFATRQRPTSVIFGAAHLGASGIPSHFPQRSQTIVGVFSDLAAMHEFAQSPSGFLLPSKPERFSYIYLSHENIWLTSGVWFGAKLAKLGNVLPKERKAPYGLNF